MEDRCAHMRNYGMNRHACVHACGMNKCAYVRTCGLNSRALGARLMGEKLIFLRDFNVFLWSR
jgi:hypothetical protein